MNIMKKVKFLVKITVGVGIRVSVRLNSRDSAQASALIKAEELLYTRYPNVER